MGHTLRLPVHFWMFASPVVYPASQVPESKALWGVELPLRALYGLNPMAGVIEGFRWALLGKGAPPQGMFWVSVAITLLLLVTGLLYFRRMEKTFADTV